MSKTTAANNSKKKEEEKKQQNTSANNSAPKATPNTTQPKVEAKQTSVNVVKPGAQKYDSLTNHNRVQEIKTDVKGPNYDPVTSVAPKRTTSTTTTKKSGVNPNSPSGIKAMYGTEPQGVSASTKENKVNKGLLAASIPALTVAAPMLTTAAALKAYKDENNRQVEIPTLSNDEVVDYYESIPDYNLLQRTFGKDKNEKRDAYKVKQQLADQYYAQKDEETKQLIKDSGISPAQLTLMGASSHIGANNFGMKGVANAVKFADLKRQGFTDDEAMAILNYSERRFDNALSDALIEKSGESTVGKIAGTEASVPIKLASATKDVVSKGVNYALGKPMTNDDNSGARGMNLAQGLREKATENMGMFGKTAYGIGMSMADMLAASVTGGASGVSALPAVLMGMEQGSDVMKNAIDRGLNPNQVVAEGAASAIATTATEAIALGKLDDIAKISLKGLEGKEFVSKAILKFIGSFAGESFQEGAEDLANTLADEFIAGDNSELRTEYRDYRNSGMSDKDARLEVLKNYLAQLGIDMLGGGFAGGAYVGFESAGNTFRNNRINKIMNNMSEAEYNALMDSSVNDIVNGLVGEEEQIPQTENVPTQNELQPAPPMPEGMIPLQQTQNELQQAPPLPEGMIPIQPQEQFENGEALESVGNLDANISGEVPTMQPAPAMPSGMIPVNQNVPTQAPTQAPPINNGGEYTSQVALNTLRNSAAFRANEQRLKWLDEQIGKGEFKTTKVSEQQSMEQAAQNIAKNGFDTEAQRIMNSTDFSNVDVDESMLILDKMLTDGDATGNYTSAQELLDSIVDNGSSTGRALQAYAKHSRTASGTVAKTAAMVKAKVDNASNQVKGSAKDAASVLKGIVNSMNNDGTQNTQNTLPTVEKSFDQVKSEVINFINNDNSGIFDNYTDYDVNYLTWLMQKGLSKQQLTNRLIQRHETGHFEIDNQAMQAVNDIFKQVEAMPNKDSQAAYELEQQAYAIMAQYLGDGSAMDKWNAWRYLAMLGNPRTHIRNIIGNTMFGAVTNFKDNMAGILESILIGQPGNGEERTRSFITKLSSTDRANIKAAEQDFLDNAYVQSREGGANKYNMQKEIESQRKVFKDKGVGKAVNWLVDKNGKALDAEDTFAIKNKYSRTLASYLKANGKDASILTSNNPQDIEFCEKARKFALDQAKIATFHEDNQFADWLNKTTKDALNKDSSLGKKLGGYAIEAAVPFKKTPANILKQGAVEYNPFVQAPKAIIDTINYYRKHPNKEVNVSNLIDDISKGLTGAGIMALGAWLVSKGMLRASGKDAEDYAQKNQEYSLVIGNHQYTLDWAAPAVLPLFMGAELYNWFADNSEEKKIGDFFNALSRVSGPVVEMSMLQGIQDALENFSEGETIVDKAAAGVGGLGASYVSQTIPTVLGQIARTIDPYRRDTYTGEEKGTFADVMRNQLERNWNKIPVLSMLNQPYRNTLGKAEENEDMGMGAFGRAILNMASPGYLTETNTEPIYNELSDLRDRLEESGVDVDPKELFPSVPGSKYNGERLTPDQYDTAKEKLGSFNEATLGEAFETEAYQNASPEVQQQIVTEMQKFANSMYQYDMFGKDISGTYAKYLDLYGQGGMSAVTDDIKNEAAYKSALTEAGLESGSSKAREIYNNVGQEELDKYGEATQIVQGLGLDSLHNDEWNAYKSGDMDTFKNMVGTRMLLERNDLPSTEATQKYIEEHGADAIPALEEAYQIVGTIQSGTDEYGNPKYQGLTTDMLNIYDRDGADGLKKYKSALETANRIGVDDITTEEWKTYRSGNKQGFDELVRTRKVLEDNDLANTELNRSYVQEYGNQIIPVLKDANEAISQIQKGVDKYGDQKYFSPNEKMIEVYRKNGKEGVETFADIYLQNDIDGDPSNRTLYDTIPYISSLNMSDYDKGYYLSQFVSGKTVNKYLDKGDYAGLYKYYANIDKYKKAIRAYNG